MSRPDPSPRELAPPPGFEVMRSRELDPLFGVSGRWAYRGTVDGMSVTRTGLATRADACREAWEAAERG